MQYSLFTTHRQAEHSKRGAVIPWWGAQDIIIWAPKKAPSPPPHPTPPYAPPAPPTKGSNGVKPCPRGDTRG